MAGVEAAGLVLGALPLLISALEHYEDLAAPTITFFHWKSAVRKFVRELYMIRTSYDLAIRLLLKPVADISDQSTMMDDPTCRLWTEGDVANELRGRLGSAYDPFIHTIGEVAEILVETARHLNIQGSTGATNQALRAMISENPPIPKTHPLRMNFDFGKRIKFTLKKNSVKAMLERLEVCTGRIDTWIKMSERLEDEPPKSQSKLKFTGSLTVIRENASKVHFSLLRNCCDAKSSHRARLLLEQRLLRPKSKKRISQIRSSNVEREPSCFKLSFHGECHATSQWSITEFRVVEFDPSSTTTVRVKVTVNQTTSQCLAYDEPSKLPQVPDFCAYMRQIAQPAVGFCLDDTGSLRVYPVLNSSIECKGESLSLEALLPKLQSKLSIEEMYGLAITIVASIFQLSRTPWLDKKWSKKDIVFLKASKDPDLGVDIAYPFLAKEFLEDASLDSPGDTPATRDCSNLLALAVMLLELRLGHPIEDIRRSQDLGNKTVSDEGTDLHTAGRWYKEEKARGSLSHAFSQAILTCLQEYLNPDANFDDSDYCKVLEERVLQPLEEEMQFLLFGLPNQTQNL